MRSRKIQTLVALMVISCMTVTSGMPVFAAPNETVAADTEITANDGTDNRSIEKIIQNIQECDSQIEYKMGKLNELKEQILEKENQIHENEQKIELAEADIEEKDNALAERLNIIKKNGGI